jgi:hypothetical protein
MPEISLPTKATQDLIKTETDKITSKASQTSVDAVKLDTGSIKATVDVGIDTPISSRQASWGATTVHRDRIDTTISSRASQASLDALKSPADGRNYKQFGAEVQVNANTLSLTTFYTITGAGYLKSFFLEATANHNAATKEPIVELWVDNVKILDLRITDITNAYAIKYSFGTKEVVPPLANRMHLFNYPYTEAKSNNALTLDVLDSDVLFFNSKLEFKAQHPYTLHRFAQFRGGLKI